MEGCSSFGAPHFPEALLWKQWWPSGQLIQFDLREAKRSTSDNVYTQTGNLIDGYLHDYNIDSTRRRHYTSHEMSHANSWNGLNSDVERTTLFTVAEPEIFKESPGQGHPNLPSIQTTTHRKTNCYSDDPTFCDFTGRTPQGSRYIDPQPNKEEKSSPVRGTNSSSSFQHGNDRMKRMRKGNKASANKLYAKFAKRREERQGLESSMQNLEKIHRDLSNCVANLTFEVYELKMQLLHQSGCNCTLMQNYLIHESGRYIQALEAKSQQEASHWRL
ncbi:hypothetical protein FOXG_16312 [Fusarium oxysporum f. sp. lycopersici 4287]|uniref:BZIP domain-containing protein n=3 Tax=Fusarium oxysporum TaxID=5507 RepID=A0A0J9UYL8_FUSO4|nr:hypothetical protein FOXG_06537 [Fusarium oxysporum f. sp. lycopersici 4287]XP_018242729.1 hypothetical protein FOXG_06730 [Fusarium oxysporum f. sp. lycopersici 4287]XP_018244656.1 hypothetical protein FOXG_07288 [Fusarium oxysporum f. sp. lycopersici 4287]XP_018256954.1 uncharacterized protein FOXG_16312 [Fusarium oxysporum f. sp. lycopersici 4287]EXK23668.1 hypothetical protein FOMG_19571 [Fusarium oxysporum f. sp. melonis 26406]KAJ9419281.1 hypothetical protein QL093DRAFT_2565397 [Fusar